MSSCFLTIRRSSQCILVKHRYYRETVSSHIMLNRNYYHSIIPTVIVSNEEDFSYYSNSRFVDKGKHFLKKQ